MKQMGEMRYASRVGTDSEDLKGTDQFRKLVLDQRIIFKRTFDKMR